MWYGMAHEMECGAVWKEMSHITQHALPHHTTSYCKSAAQFYGTATLPVESCAICGGAMWWDGAQCGTWCNEQHARCGAHHSCIILHQSHITYRIMCNVVWWCGKKWYICGMGCNERCEMWCDVSWNCEKCGMLCCAKCAMWNVWWDVECVTAPWFATSEKLWYVMFLWCGMDVVWCGMCYHVMWNVALM